MTLYVPHQYQFETIAKIVKNDTAVFADPGLGKTSMVLTAFNILRNTTNIRRMLVIAPLRPCYAVWPDECKKWGFSENFKYHIMHGDTKYIDLSADISIINPEGLKWFINELVEQFKDETFPFDMLVVDESTKFKNSSSKRFKLLKYISPMFKRRVALTGTPMPNGYDDLWSQFYLVDNGKLFGTYKNKFHAEFFYRGGHMGYDWIIRSQEHAEDLINKAKPICTVLKSEDHLKMPELVINDIKVIMPEKAMKVYRQMESKLFAELENGESIIANSAGGAAIKCHQMANGCFYLDDDYDYDGKYEKGTKNSLRPWGVLHNAKIDALLDLFEELQGKPLLVAYNFRHDLERIKLFFKKVFKIDAPYIGSGVSITETHRLIDEWNAGNLPILLGHPASMGHGLNMQFGGNDICWFSATWNLEHYLQLNARVWRQGVTGNSVRIHRLITAKTIDIAIYSALIFKDRRQGNMKNLLLDYMESA